MNFDNRCCRCRLRIVEGKELGGTYNGVVCKNHRSCESCWFTCEYRYGKRFLEPKKTKNKPHVKSPRKLSFTRNGEKAIQCFGCYYRVPFHKLVQSRVEAQKRSEKEYQIFGYIIVE